MTIEAMKQALEALDIGLEYAESELYENRRRYEGYMHLAPDDQAYVNQIKEAITSLRQAIEQAEKQEPTEDMVLALRGASGLGTEDAIDALRDVLAVMPLYTTPQPQQAEKQEPVIGTKTWYEDGKVITQNLYPSDVYKQEKQEPVAIYQYQLASGSWIDQTKNSYDYNVRHGQATVRVVYTTPQPQREWRWLTDEEIYEAFDTIIEEPQQAINFCYNIQAKLRSKNK